MLSSQFLRLSRLGGFVFTMGLAMLRRTIKAAKTFKEYGARQVIALEFSRRVVGFCIAAAMLAGCGGWQPLMGVPARCANGRLSRKTAAPWGKK